MSDSKILPPHVIDVLELYQQRKKSSVTKYQAFVRKASEDGRFRGALMYHMATTGRWSSTGVNTQNLVRPDRGFKDVEGGANAAIPYFFTKSTKRLAELYNLKAMTVLSSCLRGMVCASTGHRLISCDYAAIEARITAFLAGEQYMIDIFRGDGRAYEAQASRMFKVPDHDVSEHQRFLGKIAILACGFAGGKGAFLSMAAQYGVDDMRESDAQGYVDQYRESNPCIVSMWGEVEGAALRAVKNKGRAFAACNGYVQYRCTDKAPYVLQCRLPSGRKLHYWYPKVVAGSKFGNPTIEFSGADSETKQWKRQEAWRGLLVENIVQAIAADLLREALLALSAAGYQIIFHVHDEVVCEMPYDQGSHQEMAEIMCVVPPWFEGFPCDAEGYESKRYQK